ncbi:hypothetical protein Agub_g10786 [Astrephomene gubernaculifera]|uniref:Uncharacterized protein n=1 Tax=Astrephomene gubernaculifera TaxID=47775 RepID=A0AAD3DYA0_9CHLO|nr:hypothetical protein Agub_g10786 [Astrephomene gubernaculifera]
MQQIQQGQPYSSGANPSVDLHKLLKEIKELKAGLLGDSTTHDNPTFEGLPWEAHSTMQNSDTLQLDNHMEDLDESLEDMVANDVGLQYILSPQAEEHVVKARFQGDMDGSPALWAGQASAVDNSFSDAASISGLSTASTPAAVPTAPHDSIQRRTTRSAVFPPGAAPLTPQPPSAPGAAGQSKTPASAASQPASAARKIGSRIARPATHATPSRAFASTTSPTAVSTAASVRSSANFGTPGASTPVAGAVHSASTVTPSQSRTARQKVTTAVSAIGATSNVSRTVARSTACTPPPAGTSASKPAAPGCGAGASSMAPSAGPGSCARKRPPQNGPEGHAITPARKLGPGLGPGAASATPTHPAAAASVGKFGRPPTNATAASSIKSPTKITQGPGIASPRASRIGHPAAPAPVAAISSPAGMGAPSPNAKPVRVAAVAAAAVAEDPEAQASPPSLTLPTIGGGDTLVDESLESLLENDPALSSFLAAAKPTDAVIIDGAAATSETLQRRTSDELLRPLAAAMAGGQALNSLLDGDVDAEMSMLFDGGGSPDDHVADCNGGSPVALAMHGDLGSAISTAATPMDEEVVESTAAATSTAEAEAALQQVQTPSPQVQEVFQSSSAAETTPGAANTDAESLGCTARKVRELLGLDRVVGGEECQQMDSEELWRNITVEASTMFAGQPEGYDTSEPVDLTPVGQSPSAAEATVTSPAAAIATQPAGDEPLAEAMLTRTMDDDDAMHAVLAAEAAAAAIAMSAGPSALTEDTAAQREVTTAATAAADTDSETRLRKQSSSLSSFGFDAAVAFEATALSRQLAGGASSGARSRSSFRVGVYPAVEEAGDEHEEGPNSPSVVAPADAAPPEVLQADAAASVEAVEDVGQAPLVAAAEGDVAGGMPEEAMETDMPSHEVDVSCDGPGKATSGVMEVLQEPPMELEPPAESAPVAKEDGSGSVAGADEELPTADDAEACQLPEAVAPATSEGPCNASDDSGTSGTSSGPVSAQQPVRAEELRRKTPAGAGAALLAAAAAESAALATPGSPEPQPAKYARISAAVTETPAAAEASASDTPAPVPAAEEEEASADLACAPLEEPSSAMDLEGGPDGGDDTTALDEAEILMAVEEEDTAGATGEPRSEAAGSTVAAVLDCLNADVEETEADAPAADPGHAAEDGNGLSTSLVASRASSNVSAFASPGAVVMATQAATQSCMGETAAADNGLVPIATGALLSDVFTLAIEDGIPEPPQPAPQVAEQQQPLDPSPAAPADATPGGDVVMVDDSIAAAAADSSEQASPEPAAGDGPEAAGAGMPVDTPADAADGMPESPAAAAASVADVPEQPASTTESALPPAPLLVSSHSAERSPVLSQSPAASPALTTPAMASSTATDSGLEPSEQQPLLHAWQVLAPAAGASGHAADAEGAAPVVPSRSSSRLLRSCSSRLCRVTTSKDDEEGSEATQAVAEGDEPGTAAVLEPSTAAAPEPGAAASSGDEAGQDASGCQAAETEELPVAASEVDVAVDSMVVTVEGTAGDAAAGAPAGFGNGLAAAVAKIIAGDDDDMPVSDAGPSMVREEEEEVAASVAPLVVAAVAASSSDGSAVVECAAVPDAVKGYDVPSGSDEAMAQISPVGSVDAEAAAGAEGVWQGNQEPSSLDDAMSTVDNAGCPSEAVEATGGMEVEAAITTAAAAAGEVVQVTETEAGAPGMDSSNRLEEAPVGDSDPAAAADTRDVTMAEAAVEAAGDVLLGTPATSVERPSGINANLVAPSILQELLGGVEAAGVEAAAVEARLAAAAVEAEAANTAAADDAMADEANTATADADAPADEAVAPSAAAADDTPADEAVAPSAAATDDAPADEAVAPSAAATDDAPADEAVASSAAATDDTPADEAVAPSAAATDDAMVDEAVAASAATADDAVVDGAAAANAAAMDDAPHDEAGVAAAESSGAPGPAEVASSGAAPMDGYVQSGPPPLILPTLVSTGACSVGVEPAEELVPAWKALPGSNASSPRSPATSDAAGPSPGSSLSPLGCRRSFRNIPVSAGSSRLRRSTSHSSIMGLGGEEDKAADSGMQDAEHLEPAWKVLGTSSAVADTPDAVAAARNTPLGKLPSFRTSRTGSSRLCRASPLDDDGGEEGAPASAPQELEEAAAAQQEPERGLAASAMVEDRMEGDGPGWPHPVLGALHEEDEGPEAQRIGSLSYSMPGADVLQCADGHPAPSAQPRLAGTSEGGDRSGHASFRRSCTLDRGASSHGGSPDPILAGLRRSTTMDRSGSSSPHELHGILRRCSTMDRGGSPGSRGHGATSESGAPAAILMARLSSRRITVDSMGTVPLPRRSSANGGDPNVDALRPAWQVLPLALSPGSSTPCGGAAEPAGGSGCGTPAGPPSAANMIASLRSSSRLSRMSSGIPEDLLAELRVQAQAAVGHLQGPHYGRDYGDDLSSEEGGDASDDDPRSSAAHGNPAVTGDGAGGTMHAWKVLPLRVPPAPSHEPQAGSGGGSPLGMGSTPQRRSSLGGRPALVATRATNASSRLAVASNKPPALHVNFGSPPPLHPVASTVVEEDVAAPVAADRPSGEQEEALPQAWKLVDSPATRAAAEPPAVTLPSPLPEDASTASLTQPVLGRRPSLKRSNSLGGSRLSRSSLCSEPGEDADRDALSPGSVAQHTPPSKLASPGVAEAEAAGIAGESRSPLSSPRLMRRSHSDRSSWATAIGTEAPGAAEGANVAGERLSPGRHSPSRPPLLRGNTTGSLSVPPELSDEGHAMGEATLARALVSRGSMRSVRSSGSRLSRMSSARDMADSAAAALHELDDIREERTTPTSGENGLPLTAAAEVQAPAAGSGSGGAQEAVDDGQRPQPVGSDGAAGAHCASEAAAAGVGHVLAETPGCKLSPGSTRRSFRSNSGRMSRVMSQASDIALADIVEEGAEGAAVPVVTPKSGPIDGPRSDHSGSLFTDRCSLGRAPPPAPSSGKARIGTPVAMTLPGGAAAAHSQSPVTSPTALAAAAAAAATATVDADADGAPLLPAWKVLAPVAPSSSPKDSDRIGTAIDAGDHAPLPAAAPGSSRQVASRMQRSSSLGSSRLKRMTSGVDEAAADAAVATSPATAAAGNDATPAAASGAVGPEPSVAAAEPEGAADVAVASATAPAAAEGADSGSAPVGNAAALPGNGSVSTAGRSSLTLANMPSAQTDQGSQAAGAMLSASSLRADAEAPAAPAAAPKEEEEEKAQPPEESSPRESAAKAEDAAAAEADTAKDQAPTCGPDVTADSPVSKEKRSRPAPKSGGFLSCFSCFGKPAADA